MIEFIKKYWDIFGGIATAIGLTIIAELQLETVQLYYSIIILALVSIGVFRILKQSIEKNRKNKKERKHNIIDTMVDVQKSVKAISLAQSPTREGERLGELIIKILEVARKAMGKFKTFFDKFKGYILTIALAVLTVIEMYGGFINQLVGGVLVINDIEVLPVVTLACTAIVGIISNGFTKEQREKVKALFSKSSTNELVKEEIKKTIKEKSAQLSQFVKILATKQHELANLNSERETLNNTFEAKIEMNNMTPQLATIEEVQIAQNNVVECDAKIKSKTAEINEVNATIEKLNTTINALKSQL